MDDNEAFGDQQRPRGARSATPVVLGAYAVGVVVREEGTPDAVAADIGDRLDHYELRVSGPPTGPATLELAVPADDLWFALLQAMAAVTQLGYRAHRVEGRPLDRPRRPATDRPPR